MSEFADVTSVLTLLVLLAGGIWMFVDQTTSWKDEGSEENEQE